LAELQKRSPIRPGERILDIGCGLDTALDFVEEPVLGFTVDTLAVELSALGLSPHARHTAGALENLPYRDASFDRVMLMNVLDHVRDARSGLRETARILRPDAATTRSACTSGGPAPAAPRRSTR
jgi:ubiquinone/menaquinone biosynthesis C-methylase UbiE